MEPTVRLTRDASGVVTVLLDVPGKSVNTISPQVIRDLSAVLDDLESQPPAPVIFASGKKGAFVAGADLFEMRNMDDSQFRKFIEAGQRLFNRIAALPGPTVAAIDGDCLGGGLELALACQHRIAADIDAISIGLPETKLGILPAWGGTTRLPRLIGLEEALGMVLAAKTVSPRKAQKLGIVDEVAASADLLAAAGKRLASHGQRQGTRVAERVPLPPPEAREKILAAAAAKTRQRSFDHYPAPLKVIEVMRKGCDGGLDAGLRAEVEAAVELWRTDACRNLMRLFFLRQGAKRAAAAQVGAKPAPVNRAAVIGGGTMGAGIVYALARAGVSVRMLEVSADAAEAAMLRVRAALDEEVAAGRLARAAADEALARVTASAQWAGLDAVDAVVEAVVERMDLKREVFAKLDRLTRPDCVLATNTSSLSVAAMARATADPKRVVGLHFFNPVPKMPLVEVIRTPDSSEQALATAIGLAIKAGKTPVLVNDAPGFIINRVLMPYLAEAISAAEDGAPVPAVDAALRRWGMPMGPFELMDEIGLDVTALILGVLGETLGDRARVALALKAAVERRWLGKKARRGFYVYPEEAARKGQPELNGELAELLRPVSAGASAGVAPLAGAAASVAEADVQWRVILPMVNEAARLLAEGVVDSADAIDLASVLGTGFAPFRGGLVRFADSVGAAALVARLNGLASHFGPRFQPAPILVRLADEGGALSGYRRSS